MDTSKRSHKAPKTFSVVSCNGVLMPKGQEPITTLRLTAKVCLQISFAPNDKLVCAGMNNCVFETVYMSEFRAMLWVFYVFQLISLPVCMVDLYNGVLFNRRYQTRESNEHQPGPSGLVIYPDHQQCQEFHLNLYTS